jgi:hypothetical protein
MSIQLYVDDCDALFARALEAGARTTRKLEDTFWGDRTGTVTDPFGYHWSIATHVRDVPQKEIDKAIEAMRRATARDAEEEGGTFRQAEEEERERHLDEL